jgi:hypothetical protein
MKLYSRETGEAFEFKHAIDARQAISCGQFTAKPPEEKEKKVEDAGRKEAALAKPSAKPAVKPVKDALS